MSSVSYSAEDVAEAFDSEDNIPDWKPALDYQEPPEEISRSAFGGVIRREFRPEHSESFENADGVPMRRLVYESKEHDYFEYEVVDLETVPDSLIEEASEIVRGSSDLEETQYADGDDEGEIVYL